MSYYKVLITPYVCSQRK